MNLFDVWLKFMKWGLIITPPVMVIVFITLPIIDAARPWSVADSELNRYGRGGLAICVGMSSFYSRTTKEEISELQRSYLLMTKAELVSITETHENGETTVSFDSSKLGFWIIPPIFLLLVWLSARFSIPRIATKLKPIRTSGCYQQATRREAKASRQLV
jgi:hypothetical protein